MHDGDIEEVKLYPVDHHQCHGVASFDAEVPQCRGQS
jgi:hypothetical protein